MLTRFSNDCLSGSTQIEPGVASVAILMCTYNGEAFLAEQLDSFKHQTHKNWSLFVSDDSSTDSTLSMLETYKKSWGAERLSVVKGPKKGYATNFLSLTCRTDIHADYFAWSDQDDIWGKTKLEKSLAWLQTIPAEVPALYCGRTELISESGLPLGYSPEFRRPPHFTNALVQSLGGGNTMVFNKAARDLLREAGDQLIIPSHDWWAYQLISGAGGAVHYDPQPELLYRQHSGNLWGTNSNWTSQLRRIQLVSQGCFQNWSEQNILALESMRHRLSKESLKTLARFKKARGVSLPKRLLILAKTGLYRQTLLGNLGLVMATFLNKI